MVTYNGDTMPWNSGKCKGKDNVNRPLLQTRDANGKSKEVVCRAISRTYEAIFTNGLDPWMLNGPPAPSRDGNEAITSLAITQTGEDEALPIIGAINETYTLQLTSSGKAVIEAASSTGILRALETFTQLFFKSDAQQVSYTAMAPVSIQDYPKFAYRGMLLDLARNWYPIADVKRTIDGLAMSKMNVIHLHITDTQSWPLEIPSLPELAQKGAFAEGLTYSPEDIRDLQEYAAERGVQAIFEIDMPGHVGIEKAYPDLSVAYNALPYHAYCAEPPCGSLRLNNTDVDNFLETLFDDLLPRLSSYTTYFHTGGDEYKAENSLLDPALKTKDKAILQPLLQSFLDYSNEQVRKHGFTRIIWDDLIGVWDAKIGNDTIIQSWHGKDGLKRLANAGYKIIDSTSDVYVCPFYLFVFLKQPVLMSVLLLVPAMRTGRLRGHP